MKLRKEYKSAFQSVEHSISEGFIILSTHLKHTTNFKVKSNKYLVAIGCEMIIDECLYKHGLYPT